MWFIAGSLCEPWFGTQQGSAVRVPAVFRNAVFGWRGAPVFSPGTQTQLSRDDAGICNELLRLQGTGTIPCENVDTPRPGEGRAGDGL